MGQKANSWFFEKTYNKPYIFLGKLIKKRNRRYYRG